jgi:dihydroorotate dehydrogenase (NAD+) catalytic subunit
VNREEVLQFLRADRLKLATVSGVLTTTAGLIEWVDREIPEIEVITTKSYEVQPNPGYREPVLVEPQVGCFGNAVGLRNPGMERGYRELAGLRRRRRLRALLNVSLSGRSIEDFVRLAERFGELADVLELNFSCPHAKSGYGAAIGSRRDLVASYVREIRRATRVVLVAKLTPNVEDIGSIAGAALEAGADGIAAINTVGPELYLEPQSGKPILYNPNGHQGGRSGEWVREIALRKIREIRQAVGPAVPILGMGGMTRGEDLLRMKEAGADVVGIGSAFIRVGHQSAIPRYVAALREDAVGEDACTGTDRAGEFLSGRRLMEYRPYPIREIREIGENLRLLALEGELEYRASQYVFLFLPGVGEKPFSIAHRNPLSFLIRRKGEFTRELFNLKEGETLWLRGVYGADAPESDKPRAVILAGGTGVALVPRLVEKLTSSGKDVRVYFGISSPGESGLQDLMNEKTHWTTVTDDGIPGRVIGEMRRELSGKEAENTCFYNIGPHVFMKKAMEVQQSLGADPRSIYSSLENRTLCGVGACGACACGERMLCKEGTFVSLEFLSSRGIDIAELE